MTLSAVVSGGEIRERGLLTSLPPLGSYKIIYEVDLFRLPYNSINVKYII